MSSGDMPMGFHTEIFLIVTSNQEFDRKSPKQVPKTTQWSEQKVLGKIQTYLKSILPVFKLGSIVSCPNSLCYLETILSMTKYSNVTIKCFHRDLSLAIRRQPLLERLTRTNMKPVTIFKVSLKSDREGGFHTEIL